MERIGEGRRGYSDLVWTGLYRLSLKPIPIFKGHFGRKRYSFWFSGVCHENTKKFGKDRSCLGMLLQKMGPMFRDFLWKSKPLEQHISLCLNLWVPPPSEGIIPGKPPEEDPPHALTITSRPSATLWDYIKSQLQETY